jgi:zinc/manganese transport system substrate-binding protein
MLTLRSLPLLILILLHAGEPPRVVTSVPVLADLVRLVGGGRIAVEALVPPGVDHHAWSPTPRDLGRIVGAMLVVGNGRGYDAWLAGLIVHADWRGPQLELGEGPGDPHFWHDVRQAQAALARIRDALAAVDPAGAAHYRARCDLAQAQLAVLDAWVRRQVAQVPAARRVLVTPHAGLSAWATAYGFTLEAVNGAGHGHEADAQRVAGLVQLVRSRGLAAVFTEDGHARGVLDNVAGDAGASVAGPLATCGPAVGQDYQAMIADNTLAIVNALR